MSKRWLKVLREKEPNLAILAERVNLGQPSGLFLYIIFINMLIFVRFVSGVASDSSSNSSSSSSESDTSKKNDSEDGDSGQESITAKKKRRKSDNASDRNRKSVRRDVSQCL